MRRLRRAASLLFALAGLVPGVAEAQPPPSNAEVSLEWRAPPDCPAEEHVRREIERLLGAPLPSSSDRPVAAVATVTRANRTWRVTLVMHTKEGDGRRSLEGDSCRSVANATALILALLVNPERVANAAAPPPPPEPPPAAAPPPPAPPPPPPPPPPPSDDRVHGSVALGGIADIGTVDKVGLGAALAAGVAWRRLRFEALGAGEPNHSVPLARPGAGATFRKLTVGARACVAALPGTFEIAGCGDAELSFLQASSFGIQSTAEGLAHWIELGLGPMVRWTFWEPFALRLEGGVGFPVERPDFVITPYGVVHTLPAITGRVGVGVDVRF